ncbi:unnamed protein product [Wickerhamomyces anomalus]
MSDQPGTAQSPVQDAPKAADYPTLESIPEVKPAEMSKSQWKKLQRKKKFQENKKEYIKIRKEKKKENNAARRLEIQSYVEKNEPIPEHLLKKPKKPKTQTKTGSKIVIDCSFDHLMNDKEKVSLSSQITRAYAANRTSPNTVDLEVTSFGGNLKRRFEVDMKSSAYQNWKNITFNEEPFKPSENVIYLSADAEEALEVLEPDMTYVIGGIVDKGRYKFLCKNKADELGLKCLRLPIDEYINLFGRRVLTTTHVVELMLEWWNGKDWKLAFEKVLPQRKLINEDKVGSASVDPEEIASVDPEEIAKLEDDEEDEEGAEAEEVAPESKKKPEPVQTGDVTEGASAE